MIECWKKNAHAIVQQQANKWQCGQKWQQQQQHHRTSWAINGKRTHCTCYLNMIFWIVYTRNTLKWLSIMCIISDVWCILVHAEYYVQRIEREKKRAHMLHPLMRLVHFIILLLFAPSLVFLSIKSWVNKLIRNVYLARKQWDRSVQCAKIRKLLCAMYSNDWAERHGPN